MWQVSSVYIVFLLVSAFCYLLPVSLFLRPQLWTHPKFAPVLIITVVSFCIMEEVGHNLLLLEEVMDLTTSCFDFILLFRFVIRPLFNQLSMSLIIKKKSRKILVLYIALFGNHVLHWVNFTVHIYRCIYRSICYQHVVMERNFNLLCRWPLIPELRERDDDQIWVQCSLTLSRNPGVTPEYELTTLRMVSAT